jgi:hypothetical protein
VESREGADIPFEIAKDTQEDTKGFQIDPSLYYNEQGEAELLKSHEGDFDFGCQRVITPE